MKTVASLKNWYADGAKGYLETHAESRVPVIDDVLARLNRITESANQELPVCFLGSSGVGKSTLINSLVAGSDSVLPQGGVGPLTAQATIVRFADQPSFTVQYLPRKKLNNLLFAIERSIDPEGSQAQARQMEAPAEAAEEDDDLIEVDEARDGGDADAATSRTDAFLRQASLLIRGNQFAELDAAYVCDGLRRAMGIDTRWNTELDEQDVGRVLRISNVLKSVKKNPNFLHRVQLEDDRSAFQDELHLHASGFLAPLIANLEVGWNAEVLKGGLVLVDLPGIGVANDEYRKLTAEWIRKARAIVLVVDRAGVTEASVDLLRTTGFLNSMLHENLEKGADPPILVVGVVKVDLIAGDARRQDKQLHGKDARSWLEHFDEHCEQLKQVIRGQLQEELGKTVDSGGEDTTEIRQEVVQSLLDRLEVHPFSAHEYRLLLEDDEDERPHIKTAEQSRIPQFGGALRQVVEARETRLAQSMAEVSEEAYEKARGAIQLVLAQWQEEERAVEEAERLRAELEAFVAPLQKELDVRKGQFREFLRETMPAHIESSTLKASDSARKSIASYLSELKGYHWATLRAAVRRGGAFVGSRHVDLPNELTLRFEDPVAVVWTRNILATLRKRSKEMGDDYVRLVGEVVDWTREQGARVKPQLVEALHDNLKADTKDMDRIGREAVSELKEAVKTELFNHVEETVRKRCTKFVNSERDVGAGVQSRMHEMFDELSSDVVDAARPAAIKVLMTNYSRVEAEIQAAFEDYPNPLNQAIESIVADHETYLRRSDAQKRGAVLREGQDLLATLPAAVASEGAQG